MIHDGLKCIECRQPIPTRKRDYLFADGTIGASRGERLGSIVLASIDTSRLFCTMRCAVRYAVRTAEKRIRAGVEMSDPK